MLQQLLSRDIKAYVWCRRSPPHSFQVMLNSTAQFHRRYVEFLWGELLCGSAVDCSTTCAYIKHGLVAGRLGGAARCSELFASVLHKVSECSAECLRSLASCKNTTSLEALGLAWTQFESTFDSWVFIWIYRICNWFTFTLNLLRLCQHTPCFTL